MTFNNRFTPLNCLLNVEIGNLKKIPIFSMSFMAISYIINGSDDCSRPIIFGEGTNIYKLEHIIDNLLSNEILLNSYLPIFRSIIHTYYPKKLNPFIEHILMAIIKKLKQSVLYHNQLSENTLLDYLKQPSGLDIIRKNYIETLFKAS